MKFFNRKKVLVLLYPALYFLMLVWFFFMMSYFTHMCEEVVGSLSKAMLQLSWNVIGIPLLYTLPFILGIGFLYKKFISLKVGVIVSLLMLVPMLYFLINIKTLPVFKAWLEMDRIINYTGIQNKEFAGGSTVCGIPQDSWNMKLKVSSQEDFEEFINSNPPVNYKADIYNKNEKVRNEIFLKFMSDKYEVYITTSMNVPNIISFRISLNVYHN